MSKKMISGGELGQLIKWTGLWVWSYFVAVNIRDMLAPHFPTPEQQIAVGVVGLLAWAYFWNLQKYESTS